MLCKLIPAFAVLFLCLLGPNIPTAHAAPSVPEGYLIEEFVSGLNGPVAFDFNSAGQMFLSAAGSGFIYRVDPDSTITPVLGGIVRPHQPVHSSDGRLFVVSGTGDTENPTIWEIVGGAKLQFITGPVSNGITFHDGFLYYTEFFTGKVIRSDLSGNTSVFAEGLGVGIVGIAAGPDGFIYVANRSLNTIYRINTAGEVTIFKLGVSGAEYLAFDSAGNLYANGFHLEVIHKIDPDKNATIFANGFSSGIRGLGFNTNGDLFACNADGGKVYKISFPKLPNAIATHSGADNPRVGVSILTEGDRHWQFGAILGNGRFVPVHHIRTHPRDGGVYRLGFRRQRGDREIITLDDPRVDVMPSVPNADGTFRVVTLTLQVDSVVDELATIVVLCVQDLDDGMELVHLPDGP